MEENVIRVDCSQLKKWTCTTSGISVRSPQEMSPEEMEKEDIYLVERVFGHERRRGTWYFHVQWEGNPEPS